MLEYDEMQPDEIMEIAAEMGIKGYSTMKASRLLRRVKEWAGENGEPAARLNKNLSAEKDPADYSDIDDDVPFHPEPEPKKGWTKVKKTSPPKKTLNDDIPKLYRVDHTEKVSMVYKGTILTLTPGRIISSQFFDIPYIKECKVNLVEIGGK
jgi:hypothetical protein